MLHHVFLSSPLHTRLGVKVQTIPIMSRHVQIQVCGLKTSLTQAEKNHGCLGKRRARRREVELGLGPPQPVLVQPGQDVVPAQGLGMGHQLLLGERAVKDVQDLRGEDGGSTQDFHVLLAGGGGGGIWVKGAADLWISSVRSLSQRN